VLNFAAAPDYIVGPSCLPPRDLAAKYRERAELARQEAVTKTDASLRIAYLDLAANWEELAIIAEGRHPSNP
jgi:hypothetical protein